MERQYFEVKEQLNTYFSLEEAVQKEWALLVASSQNGKRSNSFIIGKPYPAKFYLKNVDSVVRIFMLVKKANFPCLHYGFLTLCGNQFFQYKITKKGVSVETDSTNCYSPYWNEVKKNFENLFYN